MSEYQYYDFRAIDRALTKAEMAELRSVSTRAAITSTSFMNHYEWGDLKADPLKLLEKLLCAQNEELAEDDVEPTVPAGLGELSAPLRSLIEFLGIDEDLVEVAASASAPLNASPDREELAAWIRSLPEKEKNNLLAVAVAEPGERWKDELLRRFEQQKALRTLPEPDGIRRRTAGDLLTLAHARAEERERLLEAKRAAEAARRKAEDEANRASFLDQLEKHEEATWNQIAVHIQKRQPNEYDKAITLLIDLRDLAVRQSQVTAFQSAVGELRQEHAAKESLLRRLTKL